ncbi:PREDICTED: uncharacterized protein LOC104773398 [Camelina sativa]|uniref:Uncharacterized protein LOC104763742 n=1 Tax=Camelina sativa TaxID=90675 RepID=A0ABM0Y6H6_CAMSA|nr:PREDICTED: uncharacterized protein LOC104763742 [Camelina sativa]XP_010496303.1 PREDICTED: uncharacterized protein LOC104773398 [Camelina sativa]
MEENKAKLVERELDNKMHEFSSTVSYSPSFSCYASGDFAAAAVKVSRESQMMSYNLAKVDSVEDADFEFETSPLREDTFVHFPPFKKDVVFVVNKKQDDDFEEAAATENISECYSGNCLWSPLRSPAAGSKRSRLKKLLLTRSHSDGVVLAPSASKRCYLKEFMRRSHSDGGDASKTSSPAPGVKGKKEKTTSYKVGEGDKRRKSYLPYKQDLIGVFAGIRGFRR